MLVSQHEFMGDRGVNIHALRLPLSHLIAGHVQADAEDAYNPPTLQVLDKVPTHVSLVTRDCPCYFFRFSGRCPA